MGATAMVGAGILAGVGLLFAGFHWAERLAATWHLRSLPTGRAFAVYALLAAVFFSGLWVAFPNQLGVKVWRRWAGGAMMLASVLVMHAAFD